MATVSTVAQRWLIAGGFAVAIAAGFPVAAVASPTITCPSTEAFDPNTGACKPILAPATQTTSPVEPGATDLAPGALTESGAGNAGAIPEENGIPCNGDNTGLCIGLQENNPANTGGVKLPPVPIGASGS